MRILILGGDGYLGWPTAMSLAARGDEVLAVDNYLRRSLCLQTDSDPLFPTPNLVERARLFQELSGKQVGAEIGDLRDHRFMSRLIKDFQPETVIHYAEQPSAPYSMKGYEEANLTLINNLSVTMNLIWAVKEHRPDCHIVKLGTMGEYGTPDIDIEEGWLDIEHKGRRDTFLFPRQAGSLYHTTKIQDTDLLWFYVRTAGLRVTDLMQGPVYGLETQESAADDCLLPFFNYDDLFGTVVNRFLVQAAAGMPLTVFGKGGQTRGYLNIKDTIQCVTLSADNPVPAGELRVLNQLTEPFTVNELAEKVRKAGSELGLVVEVKSIPNPRQEAEEHYYNPTYTGLLDMGLKPHYLTDQVMIAMLRKVMQYGDNIVRRRIMPRVSW